MSTASERDQVIDEWVTRLRQRARAGREITERLAELRVTADSPRDVVGVTADRNGVLTDVTIRDGHRHLTGHELTTEIMAAMRAAHARVQEQVLDLLRERLPDDPDAVDAVADQYRRWFASDESPQREPDEGFDSIFDD